MEFVDEYFEGRTVVSARKMNTGMSNDVFLVETTEGRFILKKHNFKMEPVICNSIGIPKLAFFNELFMVEEFVEHERVVAFEEDLLDLAACLRNFHKRKVDVDLRNHKELVADFVYANGFAKEAENSISNVKRIVFSVLDDLNREFPELVGICHNDLQAENMLKTSGGIVFIDFEYSSKGNQLLDIANVFCETMCDYEASSLVPQREIAKDKKAAFVREYFNGEGYGDSHISSVLDKIEKSKCFSHFLWYLWGRNHLRRNKRTAGGDFCYFSYTKSRLGCLRTTIKKEDFRVLEKELNLFQK